MLLTIDIGTSSFKSAIWDFEGNRIAFAAIPLSISLNDGLRHEADSGQWLRAFEDSCRRLGAETPLTAVEAVVISGNGPSLVPVLKSEGEGEGGSLPPRSEAFGFSAPPLSGGHPRNAPLTFKNRREAGAVPADHHRFNGGQRDLRAEAAAAILKGPQPLAAVRFVAQSVVQANRKRNGGKGDSVPLKIPNGGLET